MCWVGVGQSDGVLLRFLAILTMVYQDKTMTKAGMLSKQSCAIRYETPIAHGSPALVPIRLGSFKAELLLGTERV